jgi:hypothetical protein
MADGATKLFQASHAQIISRRNATSPDIIPYESFCCVRRATNGTARSSNPYSMRDQTPEESRAKRKQIIDAALERRREVYKQYFKKLQTQGTREDVFSA